MNRQIGNPKDFLIDDKHKGVLIDVKPKKNPMRHLTPKKKKRK